MFDKLVIPSPKRRPSRDSFQQLYSYYAGFPESFVRALLSSEIVSPGSLIYDPWNGSGTTTSVASRLGLPAIGFDLNPVMVIVAKGRLLPASEASSLLPLTRAILKRARATRFQISEDDPLSVWFEPKTASMLRSVECGCRELLIDAKSARKIEEMSSICATLYTALFSISRELLSTFRTSNPTWMRLPQNTAERVECAPREVASRFKRAVAAISTLLAGHSTKLFQSIACQVSMADATTTSPTQIVDCVLTSPPYCTRIDYTAGTRIELAIVAPLIKLNTVELRRRMIGTTMVPVTRIVARTDWGTKCSLFLDAVYDHSSKASKGYYYLTHLDYFDKMFRSVDKLSSSLRPGGTAILIVQDSYYKNVHNDLPAIIIEMAQTHGLEIRRRVDFSSVNCMSRINTRAAAHGARIGSTESVLCFIKQ